MYEDARRGARQDYNDGWVHDTSMVGSIRYSISADSTPGSNGVLMIYFTYGYPPNEIPTAAADTGDNSYRMVATTVKVKSAALLAKSINSRILLLPLK
jgi:hypothetical protein